MVTSDCGAPGRAALLVLAASWLMFAGVLVVLNYQAWHDADREYRISWYTATD